MNCVRLCATTSMRDAYPITPGTAKKLWSIVGTRLGPRYELPQDNNPGTRLFSEPVSRVDRDRRCPQTGGFVAIKFRPISSATAARRSAGIASMVSNRRTISLCKSCSRSSCDRCAKESETGFTFASSRAIRVLVIGFSHSLYSFRRRRRT